MDNLKYIILLLTLILTSFVDQASAAKSNTDSITIQGRITAKKEIPEGCYFKCKVIQRNALDSWAGYTEIFRAAILQKSFTCRMPSNDDQFYLTFQIEYPDGKQELLNMNSGAWECPLLFEKTDSVAVTIGVNNYLEFSGRGAEKLNCQKNMYSMGFIPASVVIRESELLNKSDFTGANRLLEQSTVLALQSKLSVLDSYRKTLSPAIFSQLKLDLAGHHQYALYSMLLTAYQYENSSAVPATKQLLLKLAAKQTETDTSAAAINSIHYANSVMLMERTNAQYLHPVDSSYQKFNFASMQAAINGKYNGALRDKILFLAYMELADKPGVLDHIDQAIKHMGSSLSTTMLKAWHQKGERGKAAYSFRLPDEQGKFYKLEDFRGKVIIADFWFNGCMPCKWMAKSLSPIARDYQNNADVVFLSINVDKVAQKWTLGLQDGSYTFPGAVHLSTYGTNKEEHPMLRYYNFSGFPQLLVIDQKGEIVTVNPPHPSLEQGTKFKELIDSLLKNQNRQ